LSKGVKGSSNIKNLPSKCFEIIFKSKSKKNCDNALVCCAPTFFVQTQIAIKTLDHVDVEYLFS
jgi:hypothetical protein